MKKISVLAISTLIIGQVFNPAVSAFAAIRDGDTTWWSVEEMLEFYQEVELEKATKCGNSSGCKMDFNFEMIEMGPKYRALQKFISRQFWVTAINPSSETIKVLLFDEDMMSKSMGIEEKIYLEHLYLGWFDEWNAQIFNYNHEQFTNGSIAGLHTMYDGSSEKDGPDWIPTLTEVELSVAGSDLRNNLSGIIDYAIFAKDNMFNAAGTFNYSNCLNAPDYIDGVECRLMIPSDGLATYLPPRAQITEESGNETGGEDTNAAPAETEPLEANLFTAELMDDGINDGDAGEDVEPIEPQIIGDDSEDTEPIKPQIIGDENILAEEPSVANNCFDTPNTLHVQAEQQIINEAESIKEARIFTKTGSNNLAGSAIDRIQLNQSQVPKAPNTGKSMKVTKRGNESMPWWIVAIEILGGILILWWFLPTRTTKKQKKQKNPKKTPKTLDKKSQVR